MFKSLKINDITNKSFILTLFYVLCFTFGFAHEEHNETGRPDSWMQWIGSFHFIFLHFPIALISTTVISEILFVRYARPIFDFASRFMLIAGAILAFPTAILGLTYSYTATYEGLLANFVWWHMWLGFITAVFALFVAIIREFWGISRFYYMCLVLLFLLVSITGFLGAGMTFGPDHMTPPIIHTLYK